MKRLLLLSNPMPYLFILVFVLLTTNQLHAQFNCAMKSPSNYPALAKNAYDGVIESRSGAHLPTSGTIRGLVVFVQSKEDQAFDMDWRRGELPVWRDKFVSEMRAYFREISNETLSLNLDLYPELIVQKHDEIDFASMGLNYGGATRQWLKEIDGDIDFTKYDSWNSLDRAFRVTMGPDGSIDLLIILHRSIVSKGWMPYIGVSDLMFKGYEHVDGGDRFFYGGNGLNTDAGSSGIIVTGHPGLNIALTFEMAFKVAIHELQHKIYGDTHMAELFGGLGVNAASGGGIAMCSYERHVLGYMQVEHLPVNVDTVITLHDYLSKDHAVAIPVEAVDRYYYLLEFRGLLSEYDSAPEKGVYIYRLKDAWGVLQKDIMVISAEGNWQWRVNEATGQIERAYPDPLTGFSRLNKINIDGRPYWAIGYDGHEGMAFTDKREPFGMYRNPTSDFIYIDDTIRPKLTVEVLSMTDSSARVSISHTAPIILSVDGSTTPDMTLGQSYPNPVSGFGSAQVTVPFTLREATVITWTLYDALGRLVQQFEQEMQATGQHQVSMNLEGVKPGMYFYEMSTSTGIIRKQLIVAP
jgi:type IX secretion system substrate protein